MNEAVLGYSAFILSPHCVLAPILKSLLLTRWVDGLIAIWASHIHSLFCSWEILLKFHQEYAQLIPQDYCPVWAFPFFHGVCVCLKHAIFYVVFSVRGCFCHRFAMEFLVWSLIIALQHRPDIHVFNWMHGVPCIWFISR